MRPYPLPRVLLVLILALGACGGDDDDGGGEAGPLEDARTVEEKVADFDLADLALLTLDDLPEGWTVDPSDEDERTEDAVFECVQPEHLEVIRNEESEAGRQFDDGARGIVSSTVGVYPNPEFAATVIDFARHPKFIECYEQELERSLATEVPEGGTAAVRVEPQPAPDVGDEAVAFRFVVELSVPGIVQTTLLDFVAVRDGRAMTTLQLTSGDTPFDPTLAAQLLSLSVERIAQVQ